MIKFEHSVFALPFAYMGLFLAEGGWPHLPLFLWVTVAMVSFRTMAMAANRLIDETIDKLNPRTRGRALPAGLLSKRFAWAAALLSLAVFEVSCWRLNPLCLSLSPVVVLLAWLYPCLKRFTWLSHFLLGMILGIAPYGAWLASRESFSWVPGYFCLGIMVWVAGFDIIYALQDEAFDREHHLFSFPARFGRESSLKMTRWLHMFAVLFWLAAGVQGGLGLSYFAGVLLAAVFMVREHWLVRSYGLERIQEAFFHMNAVISISVFLAVVLDLSLGKV